MIAVGVLTTRALTKQYGQLRALNELTIDVPTGVTGLVGANGAGKSTLIKIILGLLPATSGTARVLDLDIATDGEQIRQRVGYMPEHDCLPSDVTGTELVVHMGRMSGLPAAAARERASDTLRHVGLGEERYRPIGTYSTGMKQKVKLAQALVHDPAMVFLDEPSNGLDPAGRDEMLDLIRRIGTDFGISVLVTSHLLGELERISDQIVVIEAGTLLRATSTAEATAANALLVVEVTDRSEELADALRGLGLSVTPGARRTLQVHLDEAPQLTLDDACDAVRDGAAALGVGLLRLQRQRHRMAEIFTGSGAESRPLDATAGSPR